MIYELHRQDRQYYTLADLQVRDISGAIVAVSPTDWEASFDEGLTWHDATVHPNLPTASCWRIYGPNFPGPGTSAVIEVGDILCAETIDPIVRLVKNPEVRNVRAPRVNLVD